jgi:hypothetical protein
LAAAAVTVRARTLLWLVLLGAGVIGSIAALVSPHDPVAEDEAHEAQLEPLYPVAPEQLAAVEIVTRGRLHRFERDAAGQWFHHGHAHAATDAGHAHVADPEAADRIAQALAMSARTKIERRLPFDPARRPEYGLAYPPLILILYGSGHARPLLTVETGDLAADTISRYAYLPERARLVTIPDYQVVNLRELAAAFEAGS